MSGPNDGEAVWTLSAEAMAAVTTVPRASVMSRPTLGDILARAGVPLTDDEAAALERGEEVKLRLPASGDWGKAYQGKGTV